MLAEYSRYKSGQIMEKPITELESYLHANLEEAREFKRKQLIELCEATTEAPIVHNAVTWKAGKEDQALLATVLAVGSVPEQMYWRDVTGAANTMNYADLQALAGAMLARGLDADTNLMIKLQSLGMASTIEAINAIEW